MRRRMGRPGLVGTVARTAVIAGTASAVSGKVHQSQAQAAQTVSAYAAANPQEYADFRAILAPVASLQQQCGVQVIPAQYQWAFSQFIG